MSFKDLLAATMAAAPEKLAKLSEKEKKLQDEYAAGQRVVDVQVWNTVKKEILDQAELNKRTYTYSHFGHAVEGLKLRSKNQGAADRLCELALAEGINAKVNTIASTKGRDSCWFTIDFSW